MTPKIYPVIHYLDKKTTFDEVKKAKSYGADGCFLISHKGNDEELLTVGFELMMANMDWPIGINLLTYAAVDAASEIKGHGFPMMWADNVGVSSKGVTGAGEMIASIRKQSPNNEFQVFGSVAFKYQDPEPNPPLAARNALAMGFIPTTSGSGTGSAPELKKIKDMSFAAEGVLAVASGMTPENVGAYAPHLSHILVATGIAQDEYRMDVDKLQRFIANAKQ